MNNYLTVNENRIEQNVNAINDIYRAFNEIISDLKKLEGGKVTQDDRLYKKIRIPLFSYFSEIRKQYRLEYLSLHISFSTVSVWIRKDNVEETFYIGTKENGKININVENLKEQKIIPLETAFKEYQEINSLLKEKEKIEDNILNKRRGYRFLFED